MTRLPTLAGAVRDNDLYVPAATNADLHDTNTADAAHRGHDKVPHPDLMDDDYWAKFPEPLTLQAIATVLRVSETTVLRRLQDKTIPGHFIGRSWIVFQCEFRTWLASTRNEPLPPVDKCDPLTDYDDQLGMSELMELFGKTKQTVRRWLTDKALPGYQIAGRWTVYKSELRDTLALTSNQRTVAE